MVKDGYLIDPEKRFSLRVENYIKYRPTYPPIIINFLMDNKILSKKSIVADLGSGTGILSELFLKNGNKVYGVEPNNEMRRAAEKLLQYFPNFMSINGSAEKTGLDKNSIDLITAGQAFHWFNINKERKEFIRIVKPDGYVALIWNNRRKTAIGFSSQYEKFIAKYGTDYKQVRKNEKKVNEFVQYKKSVFYNYQDLDFDGLKGRLFLVSYIPLEGVAKYGEMLNDLRKIFNENEQNGKIRMKYDTEIYYGKIN